ncbi:MAG: 6-pyruvoyl trahydropterin synthase family protein [Planctomycetota bacterium]|jgi:6-pyruvoyltetrahydropterin/6-carboxytetrahydropterin synthase
MHTLSRQIRFSIDPFSAEREMGYNSYASKPCVEGLGLYLALWVDLKSRLNPDTGFVVNVSEIDKIVHQTAIPIFIQMISSAFTAQQTVSLSGLASILKRCWKEIQTGFRTNELTRLRLELSPFQAISIEAEDAGMFTFGEKFEFAAMHRLWNEKFDAAKNTELFGKCANPAGHGHNYILEVQVQCEPHLLDAGWKVDYQKVIKEEFLDSVDHKNLNEDVPEFRTLNPTVENLSFLAWQKLAGKLKNAKLFKVTVWENDRTYCSYTSHGKNG